MMNSCPRYPVIILIVDLFCFKRCINPYHNFICIISCISFVLMCSAKTCSAELAASEVGWSLEGMDSPKIHI